MVGNSGGKRRFWVFPTVLRTLKMAFCILIFPVKKIGWENNKNAILAFALLLRKLKKRRFTPTITHHAQIFHNNRMFEVSRVNTPCRALQNPPYSKASECLKVMSVLKSMSVTLWKPKASLQNFATQSSSRGLWSMPFCRDYSRIENVKIKCSSTNHHTFSLQKTPPSPDFPIN